jgi:hypothetical protein
VIIAQDLSQNLPQNLSSGLHSRWFNLLQVVTYRTWSIQ